MHLQHMHSLQVRSISVAGQSLNIHSQVNIEQLLGALPVHLLAVLVNRQAPGAASADANGRTAATETEHGSAEPAGADVEPALDGPPALPAVYLKKGLVALSQVADLALRTPLAEKLEVRHA